eukprot:TRINITY_DN9432_c0_g1_i1.p1 TRINITY_DN9432_c0_g1~~TRINITY_DN9432_c0_g1_i1.p1  ORF type:complete len:87 (-),score=7.78 TRINITY_DN9432_c0_g1_i1:99-359(-)
MASCSKSTFGFIECPLCKIRISHPMLYGELDAIAALYRAVESRAYTRLEIENLLKHKAISEPSGQFFQNPAGYARGHFAFLHVLQV